MLNVGGALKALYFLRVRTLLRARTATGGPTVSKARARIIVTRNISLDSWGWIQLENLSRMLLENRMGHTTFAPLVMTGR